METETLTAGLFRPEDAEGVVRLFAETYGDGYPAKIVYHPDELVSSFEKGETIPVVVRTPEGRIVGYSALFRSAPDEGVYEKGNGVVSPGYRNSGIIGMVFEQVKQILPGIHDMNMFFGEAVCNHTYIQKAALASLPMVETGIEVDLMPYTAYEREKSASGRVASLLMFMTLTPRHHTVYIPQACEDALKFIYDGMDDRRNFSASRESLPAGRETVLAVSTVDYANLARVAVHEAGPDFTRVFSAEETRFLTLGAKVIQVWLKLAWPWVGNVVDILKDRGYFFGGLLPQWFGDDGLLMQKIVGEPNWADIKLATERAEKILEFVKEDWKR